MTWWLNAFLTSLWPWEILAARAEFDCFYLFSILSDKISEELSLTEYSFNYENSLVKDWNMEFDDLSENDHMVKLKKMVLESIS